MATFTNSGYTSGLTTDAQYRALWGDIESHIRSLGGWTYVSQTGDGDPSTAATGSVNTYPVFRCYSTSVGSETWYVRIDFGHNSNGPSMKVQIGSGVNGSGTLTGQTSTQQTLGVSGSMSSTIPVFVAAAAGRLMIAVGDPAPDIRTCGFSICGGLDATGAMSTGIDYFAFDDNSSYSQCIPASGTIPPQRSYWPCNFGNEADATIGGNVMTGHPFLWTPSGGRNPTLAVAVGGGSNSTRGLTTTATLYGASHTYLSMNRPNSSTFGAGTNNRPLLLFE